MVMSDYFIPITSITGMVIICSPNTEVEMAGGWTAIALCSNHHTNTLLTSAETEGEEISWQE